MEQRIWPSFDIEIEKHRSPVTISICVVPYQQNRDVVFFRNDGITHILLDNRPQLRPFFLKNGNWHEAANAVEAALNARRPRYGRPFFFVTKPECAVVTATAAYWWHPQATASAFRLPFSALDAAKCSSQDLYELLLEAWHDTKSQAYFAYFWHHKNDEEKLAAVLEICPQLAEMRQLMSCILASAAYLCEDCEQMQWIFQGANRYVLRLARKDSTLSYNQHNAPSYMASWIDFLRNAFTPVLLPHKQHYPLCVEEWLAFYTRSIQITLENVSSHEQLEAYLHLREWLQQNAPDRMDLLPS